MTGIEPVTSAWKAEVLPLNYIRWSPQSDLNQRPTLYKSVALPLSYKGIHYTYPNACCGAFKPNILTVCNGVRHNFRCEYTKGVYPISGTLAGTSQVPDSPTWARTRDRVINSHLLYQLSYRGLFSSFLSLKYNL